MRHVAARGWGLNGSNPIIQLMCRENVALFPDNGAPCRKNGALSHDAGAHSRKNGAPSR